MKYLPRPGFVLLAFHLLLGFGFMVWFSAMVGLAPVTRLGLLAFHLAINATLWLFFLSATGVLLGIPLVGRWPALSFAIRLIPGVALTLNIFLWVGGVIYFHHPQLNIWITLAAGAL